VNAEIKITLCSGCQSTFCRKDAFVDTASCYRHPIVALLRKMFYIIQRKLLSKYLFYTLTTFLLHTTKFWKMWWSDVRVPFVEILEIAIIQ